MNKNGQNSSKILIPKILENTKCSRFFWYWLPLIIYASIIFYLSSLPHPPVPSVKYIDKILHFSVYAGFGFLVCRALQPTRRHWSTLMILVISVFGAVSYGLSDEIHQLFVPPRSFELLDLLADATGGFCGGLLFLGVRYVFPIFTN